MKLESLNPWWAEKKVPAGLAPDFKRKAFKDTLALLGTRQIIALCGLRRTGKTTIMHQTIQQLIRQGIHPENILYFSFDMEVNEIEDILAAYTELFAKDIKVEKLYFFFDEVQKLNNWQNKLKLLYDFHPNIKIFVTGSASLKIEKRGKESLAGRIFFNYVKPLSFKEWLAMKGIEVKQPFKIYESKVQPLLNTYILSALPEIINASEAIAVRYIKEGIIDRVVFKDIPEEFKDAEYSLLLDLLDIFYSNPGEILNIDSLARELKRSKTTISNHLFYLKFSMLIRIVKNYRGSKHSASRKLQKVYPYHPILCIGKDVELSKLIEALVISEKDAEFYWREKDKEIDAVVNKEPIEVKYRREIRTGDLKNLIYFMVKFGTKRATLVTKSEKNIVNVKEGKIYEIPAWRFLLEI